MLAFQNVGIELNGDNGGMEGLQLESMTWQGAAWADSISQVKITSSDSKSDLVFELTIESPF